MTTAKLQFTRFVRRANSGTVTNTQFIQAMESVADALKSSPWIESTIGASVLPVNVPTRPDFSGEEFDCYRQSGNAQTATGTQDIFGGMAAYRLRIPAEASETFVRDVSFRAATDKFCVGGLKVAAILSNDPAPPEDWSILRLGGAGGVVDSSGNFATLGTVDTEENETAGILAETAALVSASENHAGEFTLDLSAVTTAYQFLYLVVSLFDFAAWRREYWVEGSGLIDGPSIAVTFSGDITIPVPPVPVVMAARQVGASTRVTFSDSNYNLTDQYLRLHWGARMLLAGFADVGNVADNPTTLSQHMRLAPRVQVSGFDSRARGEYAEAYTAEPLLAGSTLWIRATEAPEGAARIRVSVLDQTDAPDVTAPSVWDGSAANCIGTALVHPGAGKWVGIPITKNASTRRVFVIAAVAEVPPEDAAFISVGFANAGLDLTDMHVASAVAVPAVPVLPAYGILTLKPDTLVEGDIFGVVRSGLTINAPLSDRGNVGLTSAASACWLGTSYGAWTALDGTAATAVAQSNDLAIWSGDGFFLAQDTRLQRWLKSGSLPVALATLTAPTTRAFLSRIVVEGGAVAWVDDSAGVGVKTLGETGSWKTEMDAWTNVMIVAKSGGITIGIADDGAGGTVTRAYVAQDGAGVKTALEAITNAYDVVIDSAAPYHRIIFRMMDGTVRAFSRLLNAALVEDTAVSAWASVTDVGIADGKFWGLSGNTLLCSGTAPSWADDSAIPATATRKFLLSGTGRLGVAYS
jgi:hypothetical protein